MVYEDAKELINHLKLNLVDYGLKISLGETVEIHYPTHFQIIYYREATPVLEVGKQVYHYKKGSLFVVSPHTSYTVKNKNEACYEYYCFEFDVEPAHVSCYFAELITANGHVLYQDEFVNFETMFAKLFMETNNKAIGYDSILYSGLLRMVIHIIRAQQKKQVLEFEKKHDYPQYNQIIQKATAYIHKHLSEPIKVETMSQAIGVSSNSLYKAFIAIFDKSPSQYILRLKVHQAEQLIKCHCYNIEEIARQLGFSSAYHFSKTFKEIRGISPKKYEIEIRNKAITSTE